MMANKFNGDDLEKECAEAFKNLFDKVCFFQIIFGFFSFYSLIKK